MKLIGELSRPVELDRRGRSDAQARTSRRRRAQSNGYGYNQPAPDPADVTLVFLDGAEFFALINELRAVEEAEHAAVSAK